MVDYATYLGAITLNKSELEINFLSLSQFNIHEQHTEFLQEHDKATSLSCSRSFNRCTQNMRQENNTLITRVSWVIRTDKYLALCQSQRLTFLQ